MCDNNFPSLVASLFSWRCLAASTSSFLHAAMNLRPPSAIVSSHTSASNAVAFQSPAVPNARMSLCTQSVLHSSPFHPVLSALHPQGFRTRLALAAARTAHSDERPRPQKSSCVQSCLNTLTLGSRSTIGGGWGWGCHIFVPVLGGDGTKIAPPGDLFEPPPGEMS